jgi:hypothetical protein
MQKNYHPSINFIMVLLCMLSLINSAFSKETAKRNCTFWVPEKPPRATYKFTCEIEPTERLMKGNGNIRITNHTKAPICRLAIDWVINSRQSIEIRAEGKPVRLLNDANEDPSLPPLSFELHEPLLPGRELELTLSFSMTAASALSSGRK